MQNIVWGAGQPFAGRARRSFRRREGDVGRRAALCARARADGVCDDAAGMLNLSAGVLDRAWPVGLLVPLVLASFGKLLPDEWRSIAFGFGTAAGSFGQFLFSPLAVALSGVCRLADDADHLCSRHSAVAAARAGARLAHRRPISPRRPAPRRRKRCARRITQALRHRSYHSAGARLLHLRLPAAVHHRPYAGLSGRPRPAARRSAAGPLRSSACSTSSGR